jgi:hypothetical protein
MSKKNFSGGLNTLLEGSIAKQEKPAQDEPVKAGIKQEAFKPAEDKKPKGYRQPRATFLIDEDKVETLKAIAYWERKKIKDLIEEALDSVISSRNPEEIQKALIEFKKLNTK